MNNKKTNKILLAGLAVATASVNLVVTNTNEVKVFANTISGGNISTVGSNSSAKKASSCLKYFDYFEQYGEMYGVDPYLLMAMACTESNGDVNAKGSNSYGLMQILYTGGTRTIKAYNHQTKKEDTIKITSSSQLLGSSSVAFNIKAGAMQLQEKARELYYNPLATIQGYNFGQNGVKRAIAYYVADGDVAKAKAMSLTDKKLVEYIQSNDSSWVTKTFNGKTALQLYTTYSGGGTASYLINTLGYYLGQDKKPWIMDSYGNKYVINESNVDIDVDDSKIIKKMISKTDDLKVRLGASTIYSVVGSLNKGDVVEVLEELSNGWVKVYYNKKIAYVSNVKGSYLDEYIEVSPLPPSTDNPSTPPEENIDPENKPSEDKPSDNENTQKPTILKSMKSKTNDLKIRVGPSTSYTSVGTLKKGEVVKVIEELTNGWVKIYYNDEIRYVSNVKGAYLENIPVIKKQMKSKTNNLKIRTGASTNYSVVSSINTGDVVDVIEELSNGWVKIYYNDNIRYVSNVKGAYLENVKAEKQIDYNLKNKEAYYNLEAKETYYNLEAN